MLQFLTGSFALAGIAAAAAPVVMHLLNKRRTRVVAWAAFDLLREAAARRQRFFRLRDLLLLVLRSAALLLLGLALARPYLSTRGAASISPHEPVHAIALIDNSLSMGYEELGETRLSRARTRADAWFSQLPPGSRFTVIPLCSTGDNSGETHRQLAEAREALNRIRLADKAGRADIALTLLRRSLETEPDLPAKRQVVLSDRQQATWNFPGAELALRELPEVQFVSVGTTAPANAWVSQLRLQDTIAESGETAGIVATIAYEGPEARKNVAATLQVDGTDVASTVLDLEPGERREIRFEHRFLEVTGAHGTSFVPVSVRLTNDNLAIDDHAFLAAPVAAALPVVFVDSIGAAGEIPERNQLGETLPLRRLLATFTGSGATERQATSVRHLAPEQVDRDLLREARLVVIAGVATPAGLTSLLREFCLQGGQLLIAAGGDFDPTLWQQQAWLDGNGILPVPLGPEFVGKLPTSSSRDIEPFFLAPASMTGPLFAMSDTSRDELQDLYRTPLFFQAVAANSGADADLQESEAAPAPEAPLDWLTWAKDLPAASPGSSEISPSSSQPRVLAEYSNGLPFLVERPIGRGRSLLVTSSLSPSWNDLARTNAVLIYDRLLRDLLSHTLPARTVETYFVVTLPVEPGRRRDEFRLERAGSSTVESLPVEAIGADSFGLVLRHLTERGMYTLSATSAANHSGAGALPQGRATLAVNGPPDESDLRAISDSDWEKLTGNVSGDWLGSAESIAVAGATSRGGNLWPACLAAAIGCLLAETTILAMFASRKKPEREFSAD